MLLGKRVNYLGHFVIVVGLSLSLHRCGLPSEIAIELFQTFVICGLIRHLAPNIGIAKSKIREKWPIVWKILQDVMRGHPILLNRVPTLHRLEWGITISKHGSRDTLDSVEMRRTETIYSGIAYPTSKATPHFKTDEGIAILDQGYRDTIVVRG
ncbi:hypothetical protein J1N35_025108 [Gossypium stocksii]|uniref:DNA-directed RNA polymerase n=1 Tax=Gossypium stocksii TaxID=47602 RepID=A0A9D3ZVW4_9ROSI|nr:hypothetical protein J1N35_025108 [Gossypium stocksii]